MNRAKIFSGVCAFLVLAMLSCTPTHTNMKPRILVTTDIGGDPDDTQSMVRLLVTANEIDLEGLIASASGTPGELDTFVVRPDLILELIEGYGSVYENLLLHHPDYPHPSHLMKLVKSGNPMRGMDHIGDGLDTEGSEWIENAILKEDDRPLNICVWGGQTDLYQALLSLKTGLSREEFAAATEKVRIYNINDQDHLHQWFREEFPGLFHILAKAPEGIDKREGAYRGVYLGGDESLTSRDWIYEHVKENHGSLGAMYPDKTWTAPNPHGCLKEGDTPSWFYFLNNGLQVADHPAYGGWGGRFQLAENHYYVDDWDFVDSVENARATVFRWREAFQNDFEARMDWCVKPPAEANHHPFAEVNGDKSKKVLEISTEDMELIRLDARDSSDPDGDELTFRWWIYPEPSKMNRSPGIEGFTDAVLELDPTLLSSGNAVHVILEARDQGSPPLTSYRRIILHTP